MSCFSFWKAFVKCPIMSVFVCKDKRCCSVGLNFLMVYYTEVSGWFVPKITKLWLNLLKLGLESCGLFFSRTRCIIIDYSNNKAGMRSHSWTVFREIDPPFGVVIVNNTLCRAMLRRALLCDSKSSVCPSVGPSVCLSVCDVEVWFSHRLEYFENNFTAK